MRKIARLYTFVMLVGGGAVLGFALAAVIGFILGEILLRMRVRDLGDIAGVVFFALPVLAGMWIGYKRYLELFNLDDN